MTTELDMTCQCDRWEKSCTRRMTQEDYLCDECRKGCSMWRLTLDGQSKPHYHALILFAPAGTDPIVMPPGTEGSVWK